MHCDVLVPNINCDHRLKIEGLEEEGLRKGQGQGQGHQRMEGGGDQGFLQEISTASSSPGPQRHRHGLNLPCLPFRRERWAGNPGITHVGYWTKIG